MICSWVLPSLQPDLHRHPFADIEERSYAPRPTTPCAPHSCARCAWMDDEPDPGSARTTGSPPDTGRRRRLTVRRPRKMSTLPSIDLLIRNTSRAEMACPRDRFVRTAMSDCSRALRMAALAHTIRARRAGTGLVSAFEAMVGETISGSGDIEIVIDHLREPAFSDRIVFAEVIPYRGSPRRTPRSRAEATGLCILAQVALPSVLSHTRVKHIHSERRGSMPVSPASSRY